MFDRAVLAEAIAAYGKVARVAVVDFQGSAPRDTGAGMLVWAGGQSGTIGGGTLEYEAARAARRQDAAFRLSRHALGPDLGQCCGGRVTLVTEVFDVEGMSAIPTEGLFARGTGEMPLAVQRALRAWRNAGTPPDNALMSDWVVDQIDPPATPLWIWGAGHVGRALVSVLNPLPDLALTWVDDAPHRFPEDALEQTCSRLTLLPSTDMPAAMALAPPDAHHLILTYSHEIDLALCHAALRRGFARCGLIGSKTKWARFRKRLTALGHADAQIARITCPIGDPSLGKHPQAIAVGVAARYLFESRQQGCEIEGVGHGTGTADT